MIIMLLNICVYYNHCACGCSLIIPMLMEPLLFNSVPACSRATIPMDMDDDESLEDYFVSENVCTSILYESKNSIKRCREVRCEAFLTSSFKPYCGYILTHENLRVLNIRRLKMSDTRPHVILPCIRFLRFNLRTRAEFLKI